MHVERCGTGGFVKGAYAEGWRSGRGGGLDAQFMTAADG